VNNFVIYNVSSYVSKWGRINLSKSEIVPVGDVGDVEGLASILGWSGVFANEIFGSFFGSFLQSFYY